MMRSIVTVIVLLWGMSTAVSETRMEAATSALLQQVQLISLIESNERFLRYQRILTANEPLSVDDFYQVKDSVAQFWQHNGITAIAPYLVNDDDPYTAVLALEPNVEGFLPVNNRIRYLLWLAKVQPWTRIEPNGWLKPGDSHPDISAIVDRLRWLGDYDEQDIDKGNVTQDHAMQDMSEGKESQNTQTGKVGSEYRGLLSSAPTSTPSTPVNHSESYQSNDVYDDNLRRAILTFQERHGLNPDAIIGPATLRWLNVTPINRARLLAVNFVNRAKYMSKIGKRYLLINIPAYDLVLVDDNQTVLHSKVIVGKPYRPTPVIQGEISNLVINPSWRVPRRLLKYDLLPKVRQDGGYINQHNFEAFNYSEELVVKSDEEWRDLARGHFPYRLVQKPGVNNTLGRYKLYFPNQYSVYLHDTQDKALFARSDRALSSGCIRVEKVEQLANWIASNLVRDKQTWVDMQIERTKTQWFAFDDKLPVHLVYWTSWLDEHNIAQFRDDIYKKNQNIIAELQAYNSPNPDE